MSFVIFSRELVFNMSEAVSHELRAFYNDDIRHGIRGQSGLSCFSPVINIMRHPLWGRNQVKYIDCYMSVPHYRLNTGLLVSQFNSGLHQCWNHCQLIETCVLMCVRFLQNGQICRHQMLHANSDDTCECYKTACDTRISKMKKSVNSIKPFWH